jgi:hypothetical protein
MFDWLTYEVDFAVWELFVLSFIGIPVGRWLYDLIKQWIVRKF